MEWHSLGMIGSKDSRREVGTSLSPLVLSQPWGTSGGDLGSLYRGACSSYSRRGTHRSHQCKSVRNATTKERLFIVHIANTRPHGRPWASHGVQAEGMRMGRAGASLGVGYCNGWKHLVRGRSTSPTEGGAVRRRLCVVSRGGWTDKTTRAPLLTSPGPAPCKSAQPGGGGRSTLHSSRFLLGRHLSRMVLVQRSH